MSLKCFIRDFKNFSFPKDVSTFRFEDSEYQQVWIQGVVTNIHLNYVAIREGMPTDATQEMLHNCTIDDGSGIINVYFQDVPRCYVGNNGSQGSGKYIDVEVGHYVIAQGNLSIKEFDLFDTSTQLKNTERRVNGIFIHTFAILLDKLQLEVLWAMEVEMSRKRRNHIQI